MPSQMPNHPPPRFEAVGFTAKIIMGSTPTNNNNNKKSNV